MKKIINKVICLILVISLFFANSSIIFALDNDDLSDIINNVAKYVHTTVKSPQVGSIGGEWAVFSLARSNYSVPKEYYDNYYKVVEEYVKACKGNLHDKKYTEYSRLIVALTAIGADPRDVAGYNLLLPLGDYNKTIWQGLNGPIWALIALDSGNYEMPVNENAKIKATREMYVQRILDCQLEDGGWSLFGGTAAATSVNDKVSDPDITGMALQALAKYQSNPKVKKATEEALACMSNQQNANAGFKSWGTENSESCVQMICALGELGISLEDKRFVKNGKTMLDNLKTYYLKDNGFLHTADGSGSNLMATEQGLYGLVSAYRLLNNKTSLYRMTDVKKVDYKSKVDKTYGLPEKHKDVNTPKITKPMTTFSDITGVNAHANQAAIEALAAREIINGKSKDYFDPNNTMTRAEFATIIVKALGLTPKANNKFTDVKGEDWFAKFIGTAVDYGIVNGKTSTLFVPNGTITREEAATMVARAAKLCGINKTYSNSGIRDVLAQFTDYVKCSDWAMESLALCYDNEILDSSVIAISPRENVIRCEVAQIVYNLLAVAKLL